MSCMESPRTRRENGVSATNRKERYREALDWEVLGDFPLAKGAGLAGLGGKSLGNVKPIKAFGYRHPLEIDFAAANLFDGLKW